MKEITGHNTWQVQDLKNLTKASNNYPARGFPGDTWWKWRQE
jgi:hypothetical protein